MADWTEKIYKCLKKNRLLRGRFRKDREKMLRLYPGESGEQHLERYYAETIGLLVKIGIVGLSALVISSVYWYFSGQRAVTFLERGEQGEGTEYVDVVGIGQEGARYEGALEIHERQYTEQEIRLLYYEVLGILETVISGSNESLMQVEEDLVFPEEIYGYPFRISWESSDNSVINSKGVLNGSYRDKGVAVTVTAKFTYDRFKDEHSWKIVVSPSRWTEEQLWKFNVERTLRESDENSLNEKQWILPTEIQGEEIQWQLRGNSVGTKIVGLLLLGMVLVVWGRDNDLQRKLKQRDRALEEEYSNIVTKLTLYMGAGMTVKGAWKKTAAVKGYTQGVARQEMLLTCREMDSGVYESRCYENFGQRCGRQEYIRLGTLLSQNLKKGNTELLNRLQAEVQLAWEKQKHLLKRRGEEASTKLLGPMVILLGITMMLVMVPAFSGIG